MEATRSLFQYIPPLFHVVKLYTGGKNERQRLATLRLCLEALTCSLWSVKKNILASDAKKTFQQTGFDSTCHLVSERKKNPAGIIHAFKCKQKLAGPGHTLFHCPGKGGPGLPVGCNGINWEVRGRKSCTNILRFQAKTAGADQTTA